MPGASRMLRRRAVTRTHYLELREALHRMIKDADDASHVLVSAVKPPTETSCTSALCPERRHRMLSGLNSGEPGAAVQECQGTAHACPTSSLAGMHLCPSAAVGRHQLRSSCLAGRLCDSHKWLALAV